MTVRYSPAPLPLAGSYDLIVAGGGPAGTAAALAARREGLQVLLVEGQACLGGMGTSGLVSHWLGGRTSSCRHWVVGGIFRSWAEEAARRGFALLPSPEAGEGYSPFGWNPESGGQLTAGVPFDPFEMAAFLDEKLQNAGVDLLLETSVVDVIGGENELTHLVLHNKSGLQAAAAPLFVDATGDADLAVRSGCDTICGREEDGKTAPATLELLMDNIDQKRLAAYINENHSPRFLRLIERLKKEGKWPFPYDRFISVQLTEPGIMLINTPRLVGVDGTAAASRTAALVRGRREIFQLREILRKYFPGCKRARVRAVAPLLGVRESRRIRGRLTLTVEDLQRGREFPDTIGFSAYGWDLPDPKNPSYNPSAGKCRREVTPLPYRILLPRPVENLIVPGRAVSVERPVLGPVRVQAPCMAMGEAAGTAAALAAEQGNRFDGVDYDMLRCRLRQYGAVVDYNPAWEKT